MVMKGVREPVQMQYGTESGGSLVKVFCFSLYKEWRMEAWASNWSTKPSTSKSIGSSPPYSIQTLACPCEERRDRWPRCLTTALGVQRPTRSVCLSVSSIVLPEWLHLLSLARSVDRPVQWRHSIDLVFACLISLLHEFDVIIMRILLVCC
jgi:hypothetical protein